MYVSGGVNDTGGGSHTGQQLEVVLYDDIGIVSWLTISSNDEIEIAEELFISV